MYGSQRRPQLEGPGPDRWTQKTLMTDHQILTVLVLLSLLLQSSSGTRRLMNSFPDCTQDDLLSGVEVQPSLAQHSEEFDTPTVTKVTDGVYVAVGFALANSILLEGEKGVVVVDVTESVEAARAILALFRKYYSSKPITDIVYTHNHGDHVFGAEGFIEDVDNPPDIWAYHSFSALVRETLVIGPKLLRGVAYQMGARLDPKYVINSGLGPGLHMDTSKAIASLEPNRLVCSEEEEVFLWAANLTLTFIHIPGETEDQMAVWLPNKRVLLPADDLYKTFPNLYAVRGTPPRNSMTWHNSLKRMRDLGAEYLVPSHTQPVVGRQWIHDTLTTYMAAIRYVHDQTVRHMNRGLHPDEVASRVKRLPPSLASLPYLQQFYGTTVWSSKGVFENYVGWFSGDPVDLLPLGPTERSRRMVSMMGVDGLLAEAKVALEEGELQWALETVSHVYRIQPEMRAAQDLRWKVLRKLAGQQTNPIARNFYMTTILSDHGLIDWTIDQSPLIESLPVNELFDLMRYKVKAEVVDGVNLTIVIRFKDTRESYRLRLCHSVLEVEMLSMETISAAEAAGWTGKVTEGGGRGTREAAGECAGAGGAAGRVGGGLAAGKVTGGVAGETRRGGGRAAPGGPRRGAPEKPGVRVRGGAISEGEDRWIEEDGAFNVRIVTESTVWRQVLAKKRSLEQCIESGEIRLDPVSDGRPKLHRFFASFDTN